MTKILLIEDYQTVRELYSDLLEQAGYEVEPASDGEEGLRKILANSYDLILLDLVIPKINGISLLKKLKESGKTSVFPKIVILYTIGEDDLVKEALQYNVKDAVQKSTINPEEVIKKVIGLLVEG